MSANGPDELTRRFPYVKAAPARHPVANAPTEPEEESCAAFGYLRGMKERALTVEFRLRKGDSEFFSYSLLASWRYDPSVGLLLKFTADVVTLVLIHGSNLDAPVNEGGVNLIDQGLQRHRVLWVREMDAASLKTVGDSGPTVDRIELAEFESHAEMKQWLSAKAPAFVR